MGEARVDFAAEVRKAYQTIAADIVRTPLERSGPLSRELGADVYIKWECDQTTGSFKLRGALNKLRSLGEDERRRGIVSASTGNHGLAISHAAKLEGVGLKLFLPETVAEVKKKRIEGLGVDVEVRGASCDKAEMLAREFAARNGRIFVSPYNDWDIVFGPARSGSSSRPAWPGSTTSSCRSAAAAHRRHRRVPEGRPSDARVVGVEPETSAFMAASIAAGRLVDIEERETIADAVAGGIEPGAITFPLCRELVQAIEVVPRA